MKQQTTVFDMKRVVSATSWYEDRLQMYRRAEKPTYPTVCNTEIPEDQVERAKQTGMLDEWVHAVEFVFTSSYRKVFKGSKTTKLWNMWTHKILDREK